MQMNESECVKMKRRGAELIARQIAGMARAQEIEHWRVLSKKMRERKEAFLTKSSSES